MQTQFELGQKVITRKGDEGIGIVVEIANPDNNFPYPIKVEFDYHIGLYTLDGFANAARESRTDIIPYIESVPVVEAATIKMSIGELRELLIEARKYTIHDDDYTNTFVDFDQDVDQIIREVEASHIMHIDISKP